MPTIHSKQDIGLSNVVCGQGENDLATRPKRHRSGSQQRTVFAQKKVKRCCENSQVCPPHDRRHGNTASTPVFDDERLPLLFKPSVFRTKKNDMSQKDESKDYTDEFTDQLNLSQRIVRVIAQPCAKGLK
jgi:hypothetical protein